MTRYRHVVWDWNGTLLDDAWLCLEVINALLERDGLPTIDAQRYAAVFGFPLEEYCRQLGFRLDRAAYERLSEAFSELYEARRLECRLRCGARQVLQRLRALGVTQSLLSAYTHHRLLELVDAYGLAEYLDAVVGVDNDYGEGKVELGLRHLQTVRCPPAEVLLVGDTVHDWEVAQAAGAACALIDSGHQQASRLRRAGVPLLANLHEVVALASGTVGAGARCADGGR